MTRASSLDLAVGWQSTATILHPGRRTRQGRAHVLIGVDQSGSLRQIVQVQHALGRDFHKVRIGNVLIAIRKSESIGLSEQVHIGRVQGIRISTGGISILQELFRNSHDLTHRQPTRSRRSHATNLHSVTLVGNAHGCAFHNLIGGQVLDRHVARNGQIGLNRRSNIGRNITSIKGIAARLDQGQQSCCVVGIGHDCSRWLDSAVFASWIIVKIFKGCRIAEKEPIFTTSLVEKSRHPSNLSVGSFG
mmetsp:Transcript_25249/g.54669  ORF Transcript_25249/g.54669 Transcript_25249/m.54669 type:complete len:247 (-) Transcript_25249:725-1465(-)